MILTTIVSYYDGKLLYSNKLEFSINFTIFFSRIFYIIMELIYRIFHFSKFPTILTHIFYCFFWIPI